MVRFWAAWTVLLFCTVLEAGASERPRVSVSIQPLHSLVAGVMEGVGAPDLIVKGGGSPHAYTFKPSEAMALSKAEMVVWVGESLERFLVGPLRSLAPDAVSVELMEAPGLTVLPLREGGAWDAHDHNGDHDDGDHDHDPNKGDHAEHDSEHADHDHDNDHTDHDDRKEDDAASAVKDDHDDAEVSAHIWLDPENARAMVAVIAVQLIKLDPDNAATYQANAAKLSQRLAALTEEIERDLASVKKRPFVVFHDAYHNFEARFGLTAVGSVTVSPELQPGAARIAELREKIRRTGAVCLFSEPQFNPKLAEVLIEGMPVKTGVLDPLGATLETGPELYFEMMRRNTRALAECLSG